VLPFVSILPAAAVKVCCPCTSPVVYIYIIVAYVYVVVYTVAVAIYRVRRPVAVISRVVTPVPW
jgi:hypothetical protein